MPERDPASRRNLDSRDDSSVGSTPPGEPNSGDNSTEGLDTKSSSKKAPASNTLANAVPVSNTSPLLNLAVTGHLELLRERFGEVVIPPAVRQELRVDEGRPGSEELGEALKAGWLRERAVEKERSLSALLQSEIDRGESEAIALAVELGGRRVLLDEREGRRKARALELETTGVLGILLWASGSGKLDSGRAVIRQLRSEAGFFVAPSLEKKVLQEERALREAE